MYPRVKRMRVKAHPAQEMAATLGYLSAVRIVLQPVLECKSMVFEGERARATYVSQITGILSSVFWCAPG